MKRYIYAAMFGLFVGTVAGVAGAAPNGQPTARSDSSDAKRSEASRHKESPKVGRCVREVSFNETKDGSFVVRSAWRCETAEKTDKKEEKK